MIQIHSNLSSSQEFYRLFKENVKYAPASAIDRGSLVMDAMIGAVTYDGFWLMKTGPLGSRGLQRCFRGRCAETDAGLTISGRFCLPRRLVIFAWIAAAVFFLLLSPLILSAGRAAPLAALLLPLLIPLFAFGYCILFGMEQEHEVIKFLEKLARGTDGEKP